MIKANDVAGRILQARLAPEPGLVHDAVDQPWLWREARLQDPSGNVICRYHAGENRLNPPWRVQH